MNILIFILVYRVFGNSRDNTCTWAD